MSNNQVTVNVSPLTDRVDNLQASVTQLQQQLVQIRDTIPVNLPEFTEPVPVNIASGINIDLSGISAQLAEIKQVLETQLTPPELPPMPPSMLESHSLLNAVITTQGWNDAPISNLSAIVDGNPSTRTTLGQQRGDRGSVTFDFLQVNRYYLEARIGIAMGPGWDGGEGEWSIEVSEDGSFYVPVWRYRLRPTSVERVMTIPVWLSGRFLRLVASDLNVGMVRLRIYEIKAWKLNAPT